MKLLCLNVCQFEKNNEKLKDFLSSHNFDIACFQEVTRSVDDNVTPEIISYETLNKYSGLSEGFFAPNAALNRFYTISSFHGHAAFDFSYGGIIELGSLTRSRYKILRSQNIFVQNQFTYETNWDNWPAEDYKAFQVTDLEISQDKRLRIINYYGIWSRDKVGTEKTLKACEQVKRVALEVSYPSIICGDFNLFPDTDSMKVFGSEFNNLVNTYNISTTRPKENELSDKPRNIVDYILTSKSLKVNNFEVLDSNVSDHLPLVVDFEY